MYIDSDYGMLSCKCLRNLLYSFCVDVNSIEVNVLYTQLSRECLGKVDFRHEAQLDYNIAELLGAV